VCDLDCGPHGRCVGESCMCDPGWSGEFCTSKLCDARCSDHGQCKNGTCLCVSGWNGRHCTLEGCPRGCAGHGQCRVANDGHWECKCFDGWDGPDCTTLKEQICDDSKDNDKGISSFIVIILGVKSNYLYADVLFRWFSRLRGSRVLPK
jgi:teneurin